MHLVAGARLGAYEIVGPLGAGGMGEVYRASDTRLRREVAIKVLPAASRGDAERASRFEREARLLATLNHPHIAAIHGLERADGEDFIVMELVEGATLADHIAAGPLRCADALPIARQIADALEAAHEQGIIHRDLKPANIKVRPDGSVKLLDFGLARAVAGDSVDAPSPSLTHSPTMTSPALATGEGILLGTAAYMAPEQARGKTLDRRVDIWAFGCVLFEMLSGRRAFDGEDVALTLASVMKGEPDWMALPAAVPPHVVMLLKRCLEKDPRQRLRDIGDARLVLDGAFVLPAAAEGRHATPRRRRGPIAWAAAVMLAASGGAIAVWTTRSRPPAVVSRFEIDVSSLSMANGPNFTWSSDGASLVYVEAAASGQGRLVRRRMNQVETEPIPGGDGAETAPFFSPDGEWIGFVAARGRSIRKVPSTGGVAATVCETATPIYTPVWLADHTIAFGNATGLWRCDESGGSPEQIAKTERPAGGPQPLPGGRESCSTLIRPAIKGKARSMWSCPRVSAGTSSRG